MLTVPATTTPKRLINYIIQSREIIYSEGYLIGESLVTSLFTKSKKCDVQIILGQSSFSAISWLLHRERTGTD